MPINFTHPATSQLRVDYASAVRNGFTALAQLLDPAVAGTLTSTPTGAYRVKSADSGALERFNGTSWVAQPVNGLNYSAGQVAIGNNVFGGSRLTVSGPIGNNTLSINSVSLPSAAGQRLGVMGFGVDGETAIAQARISAFSAGAWSTNTSSPSYITIATTPAGATSAVERARVTELGRLGWGTTNPLLLFQLADYGGIEGNANQLLIRNNVYYDGAARYMKSGFATEIDMSNSDGSIAFLNASTGAAGAAATLLTRWKVTGTGNFVPGASNAYALGSTSERLSNLFSVLGNYSGALTALSFDSAAATDLLLRPAGTLRGTLSQAGAFTLTAQPGFAAYTLSAFTVGTGGAFTDVIYGTEDYDNGGCYDASTGVFTAPVAGKYLVTFAITPQWVAGAITDVFQANMLKNGASLGGRANCFMPRPGAISTTQIDRPWQYSDTYTLAAGDTLQWRASHGGASTMCSGLCAAFSVTLKH